MQIYKNPIKPGQFLLVNAPSPSQLSAQKKTKDPKILDFFVGNCKRSGQGCLIVPCWSGQI